MKTLILTLSILSAFSMAAFSQVQISPFKQSRDVNGAPLRNHSFEMDAPHSPSGVMTAYTYDSVRALTEINNPYFADAYPWISPDGLRLYYTTGLSSNLMFTLRPNTNSHFTAPISLPTNLPFTPPMSIWLSDNELDIYVTDVGRIYFAHRDSVSLPFNTMTNISISGYTLGFISGISLNTAQNELYLFCSVDGINLFARSSETTFTYTGKLPVPSGYTLAPGQLSKDDLTYVLGVSHNVGSSLLYQMKRVSPTDLFDSNTFQQIKGINDTLAYNGQSSMSDSLNWVVFVRGNTSGWNSDDLYIAHKRSTTSVFNPDNIKLSSYSFPNPASEYLFIRYKTTSTIPITLSVFSSVGALVYEDVINPSADKIRIDTKALKDGLYFYRLSQEANNQTISGTGRFAVLH